MLSSLYKNVHPILLPLSTLLFFSPSRSHGFNWNRGWRGGEREIFFSCWPRGTSFIGPRLCRRPGHSAYLKCIVRRCAGGYVSVNVTEFQCPRKIVFHAEIPMDPTPVSSLKIASGLFVEPWTINYFLKILSFLFILNSLSLFFFLLDSRYSRAEKFASSREMLRAALKILASKRKLPIPLLCNYILRSIFSILPFDFVFHDNSRGFFFFLPSFSLL